MDRHSQAVYNEIDMSRPFVMRPLSLERMGQVLRVAMASNVSPDSRLLSFFFLLVSSLSPPSQSHPSLSRR